MNLARTLSTLAILTLMLAIPAQQTRAAPAAQDTPMYSIWVLESSRFLDVPAGGFMPDRAYVPGGEYPGHNDVFFNLPVNYGVIKGGSDVVLYDTGWKQPQYIFEMQKAPWGGGSDHFAPAAEQMAQIGITPDQVTKVVVGHGHWDHAGQIGEFPNATLYIQGEELRGIDWALKYPNPKISAVNTSPGGCARTPACGYPPETLDQIYGKVMNNKAVVVEGEMEIAPGLRIVPAFRAHTAGSQLLAVHTAKGEYVFGSDAYSSWEGIRDWMAANIQQTDTVQQFLAYEKCYQITGGFQNCLSAHEPLSYTDAYPALANSWVGPNGSRGAEVVLAPGEQSRKPR